MNQQKSHCERIDTYIGESEGNHASIFLLKDKNPSLFSMNSMSFQTYSDAEYNEKIKKKNSLREAVSKRLLRENDCILREFAQNYLLNNSNTLSAKKPFSEQLICIESLRDNVTSSFDTDGSRFIGTINKNGQKQGKGLIILSETTKNNYKNQSIVKIQNEGNSQSYYLGDFHENSCHGEGIFIFRNNERYEGQVDNNELTGSGVYHYLNGDTYNGDFYSGMRHGQGSIILYELCASYVGEFKDDKRSENGQLVSLNGKANDDQQLHAGQQILQTNSTQTQNKYELSTLVNESAIQIENVTCKNKQDLQYNYDSDQKFILFSSQNSIHPDDNALQNSRRRDNNNSQFKQLQEEDTKSCFGCQFLSFLN